MFIGIRFVLVVIRDRRGFSADSEFMEFLYLQGEKYLGFIVIDYQEDFKFIVEVQCVGVSFYEEMIYFDWRERRKIYRGRWYLSWFLKSENIYIFRNKVFFFFVVQSCDIDQFFEFIFIDEMLEIVVVI